MTIPLSLALLEVYCQPPQEVEQGYVVAVQKTEYEVGFDIHYLCKKNFLLDGPQKVTCLSNGSWSASPPFCRGEGCGKETQCDRLIGFVFDTYIILSHLVDHLLSSLSHPRREEPCGDWRSEALAV